mmetsp:Transcript_63234/g.160470  ORF Transcript_63234/g.160470 Transcript_63234/m.160470 type:complete len:260 (-) Transcript_63234:918-1697(-)
MRPVRHLAAGAGSGSRGGASREGAAGGAVPLTSPSEGGLLANRTTPPKVVHGRESEALHGVTPGRGLAPEAAGPAAAVGARGARGGGGRVRNLALETLLVALEALLVLGHLLLGTVRIGQALDQPAVFLGILPRVELVAKITILSRTAALGTEEVKATLYAAVGVPDAAHALQTLCGIGDACGSACGSACGGSACGGATSGGGGDFRRLHQLLLRVKPCLSKIDCGSQGTLTMPSRLGVDGKLRLRRRRPGVLHAFADG